MSHPFATGCQDHSLDRFRDLLRENRITCLVDLRESPYSRKPGFSKRK